MNILRFSLRTQKGVALFVSLMMLILVTILGVTGVRMVSLEEKMAGNSYDRNLAFQAAEAALREAENKIEMDVDSIRMPCYGDQINCPVSIPPRIAATSPICSTTNRTNSDAINNCTDGYCPKAHEECLSRWDTSSGFIDNNWQDATTSLGALTGTAPQYFIEYLGSTFNCTDGGGSDPKNCKRYRVTARSNPGTGRATVMLQSIYATN